MIPLATTTIEVFRTKVADAYEEPYSGQTPADRDVVASGVRAVIYQPRGREQVAGGEQSQIDLALSCDPCDLDYRDVIRDERSGRHYTVVWALPYGASHMEAGLKITEGVV